MVSCRIWQTGPQNLKRFAAESWSLLVILHSACAVFLRQLNWVLVLLDLVFMGFITIFMFIV